MILSITIFLSFFRGLRGEKLHNNNNILARVRMHEISQMYLQSYHGCCH